MFLDACFKTLVMGTSALAMDAAGAGCAALAGAGCAVLAGAAAAALAGAAVVAGAEAVALAEGCTAKGLDVDVVMGWMLAACLDGRVDAGAGSALTTTGASAGRLAIWSI